MNVKILETAVVLAAFAGLAACGDKAPVLPDAGIDAGPPRLVPLAVGHRWNWKLTSDTGVESQKTQSVTGTVSVDGALAYRMLTTRNDTRETRSVQMDIEGRLHRVSEIELDAGTVVAQFRYEPYGLRVDSVRTTKGDQFRDEHDKIELDPSGTQVAVVNKVHDFFIEAEKEIIDVPAGSFECVRIRRVRLDPPSEKTYWYAPGIGKIKEVGGQTEELESFSFGG